MLTLSQVKENPLVLEFIKRTQEFLKSLSYTDHGLRHLNLVSDRSIEISKVVGLSKREGELAAIAAFCHDMGNFMSRSHHNYFAALIFQQIFQKDLPASELATVMQAISNHDKQHEDLVFTNSVSAVLVLADKSDVHRSRVTVTKLEEIKRDIHDRVNYATKENSLKIDKNKKRITLTLKIDTNFVSIMEYFEIFTDRMVFCRMAAEYLGYKFGIVINKIRLL